VPAPVWALILLWLMVKLLDGCSAFVEIVIVMEAMEAASSSKSTRLLFSTTKAVIKYLGSVPWCYPYTEPPGARQQAVSMIISRKKLLTKYLRDVSLSWPPLLCFTMLSVVLARGGLAA
jgi:hypothetical protein